MKEPENTQTQTVEVKEELEKCRNEDGTWSLQEIVKIMGLTFGKVKRSSLQKAQYILWAKGLENHVHFYHEKNGRREDCRLTLEACKLLTTVALVNDSRKDDRVLQGFQYFDRLRDDHRPLLRDKNEVNLRYWEKYNEVSSMRYKEEMKKLDSLHEFKEDNSYHGIYAPHHIMYKLDTLESKDKKRKYEFLIEYDVNEPTVGIYYGCKGLIDEKANNDEQIAILDKEWQNLQGYVAKVLNNIFPGKDFMLRFKATNNANDRTYWPFWITLYEEEDIIKVAAEATKVIQSIYRKYLNGKIDQSFLDSQSGKSKVGKNDTVIVFTKETYNNLLEQVRKISKDQNDGDINVALFENFIKEMVSKKAIKDEDIYARAWTINTKITNFYYYVEALFQYMNRKNKYLQQDFSKIKETGWTKVPWGAFERVFLNNQGYSFDGTLKKEYNADARTNDRLKARRFLFGENGVLRKYLP